jgi:hypothetical protein
MSVTVNTPLAERLEGDDISLTSPEFSVNGFNASLGTLTEVEVSYGFDGHFTLTNGGSPPPDVELLEGRFNDIGGPVSLMTLPFESLDIASGVFDFTKLMTFSTSSDLAAFGSLSHWAAVADLGLGGLPTDATFTTSNDDATFTVTYDYTPAVASTPEPASLFLLGTIAACALAIRKRRLSSIRQEGN